MSGATLLALRRLRRASSVSSKRLVGILGTLLSLAPLPLFCASRPVCERLGSGSIPLTVVVLHGSTGPAGTRALAEGLASRGYVVLYPHYFDAASGERRTDQDFAAWVDATRDCIAAKSPAKQPVVLFGVSLGASVALAAATQLDGIDSAIDWAGSLPDYYFEHLQHLPPLLILHGDRDTNVPVSNAQQLFELCTRMGTTCTGKIYSGEGHMFPGQYRDATERTLVFLQSRADAHRK